MRIIWNYLSGRIIPNSPELDVWTLRRSSRTLGKTSVQRLVLAQQRGFRLTDDLVVWELCFALDVLSLLAAEVKKQVFLLTSETAFLSLEKYGKISIRQLHYSATSTLNLALQSRERNPCSPCRVDTITIHTRQALKLPKVDGEARSFFSRGCSAQLD